MVLFSVSVVLQPVCNVCFVCRQIPIPPSLRCTSRQSPRSLQQQSKASHACHLNILILYCKCSIVFLSNIALFYNITMGWIPNVTAMLLGIMLLCQLGYNMIRFWTRNCLAMLSLTSTQWGISFKTQTISLSDNVGLVPPLWCWLIKMNHMVGCGCMVLLVAPMAVKDRFAGCPGRIYRTYHKPAWATAGLVV